MSSAVPRSPDPTRRSRPHAPDQERSGRDVPLVRPPIRAGDPPSCAPGECVRDRRAVRVGGAKRGRRLRRRPPPRRRPHRRRAASPATATEPPAASLAVEGGDPVTGQLGTFTWGDGGSDSPWLPGAPIAVGTGEQLTVTDRRWGRRGHLVCAPGPGRDDRRIGSSRARRGRPADRLRRARDRVVVGPGDGRLRRRTRLGVVLLARHRAMSAGIGVAHLPRRCFPRSGHTAPRAASVAFGPPCWSLVGVTAPRRVLERGTAGRSGAGRPARARRRTRTAPRSSAGTTRGEEPIPIALPKGDTTWVATGLADVLAATLADGTIATSDPLHLGKRLKWRAGQAGRPDRRPRTGSGHFATWDPEGGRYATLSGDLLVGDDVRVVLVDPSVSTAFEIPLDRSVVAAPPAWIDSDRFVVVTGDAGEPTATIVDAETGELSDGPPGARLIATSANGRRIATMAEQGAPVVVRDTTAWLGDDGSSIASIEPAGEATTAIAFALDATGQRLVDRLGEPERRGQPRHPRRAEPTGVASPNQRSAPPEAPSSPGCASGQSGARRRGRPGRRSCTENRAAGRCRRRRRPSTGASAPQGA